MHFKGYEKHQSIFNYQNYTDRYACGGQKVRNYYTNTTRRATKKKIKHRQTEQKKKTYTRQVQTTNCYNKPHQTTTDNKKQQNMTMNIKQQYLCFLYLHHRAKYVAEMKHFAYVRKNPVDLSSTQKKTC